MKSNFIYGGIAAAIAAAFIYYAGQPTRVGWEVVNQEQKKIYDEILTDHEIAYTEETDDVGRVWIYHHRASPVIEKSMETEKEAAFVKKWGYSDDQ